MHKVNFEKLLNKYSDFSVDLSMNQAADDNFVPACLNCRILRQALDHPEV
jgi:hypothetical protein